MGHYLDEEALNLSHQIIIVASSFDDSNERIIDYLSDRDIPINVLCFQGFIHSTDQLLIRAWLPDPLHPRLVPVRGPTDPPNRGTARFIAPSAMGVKLLGPRCAIWFHLWRWRPMVQQDVATSKSR